MTKIIDNIENGLLKMYLENPDLAREELAEEGHDVDALVTRGLSLIKKISFHALVATKKTQLQDLMIKANTLIKEKLITSREEVLTVLNGYQVKVQFRNIDTLTDDELMNILKDVDLIKLIEDLDSE